MSQSAKWVLRIVVLAGGALAVAMGLAVADLAGRIGRGEVDVDALPTRANRSSAPGNLDAAGVNRPALGPANAAVVVVEFYDFQCPFCKQAVPVVEAVAQAPEFADRVKFVFRHFPLVDIHPFALEAARAGECAHLAGKYVPMRKLLFGNQDRLARADLEGYAAQLGIPRDEFVRCLTSDASFAPVEQDWREGITLGVKATPTYFIGGEKIEGVPTAAQLGAAVRLELNQ